MAGNQLPPFNYYNQTPALTGNRSDSMSLSSLLANSSSITEFLTIGEPGDIRSTSQQTDSGAAFSIWMPIYLFSTIGIAGDVIVFGDVFIGGGGASGNLIVRGKMLATDQPLIPGGVVPSANPGELEMTKNLLVGGTSTLGTKSTPIAPDAGLVIVESELKVAEGAVVASDNAGITILPTSIHNSGNMNIGSAPLADTTTIQLGGFDNTGAAGGITEINVADSTWTNMAINMTDFEADVIDTRGKLQWKEQSPTVSAGTGHFAGPANATIAATSSDQTMLLQITANPGQIAAGDTLTITLDVPIVTPVFYAPPSPLTFGIFITPILSDTLRKPWAIIDQGAAPYQSFTITFPEINTATNPQYYIFVMSTY